MHLTHHDAAGVLLERNADSAVEASRLDSLIAQKENELRSALSYRVALAESASRLKDAQIVELRQLIDRLTADEQIKSNLIEERDAELARFENALLRARTALQERETLLSETRIQLADVQQILRVEQSQAAEADVQARARLSLVQQQLNEALLRSDTDLRTAQLRWDGDRRLLQDRINDLETSLASQHAELTASFDSSIRERVTAYQQDRERWDSEHATLQEQLRRTQLELSAVTAAHSAASQQLTLCQTAVSDLQERADANATAIVEARARAESLHATLLARDVELQQAVAERTEIKGALADCDALRREAVSHAEAERARRKALQDRLAQLLPEVQQLRNAVSTGDERCAALSEQLAMARAAVTDHEQTLALVTELRNNIESLTAQVAEKDQLLARGSSQVAASCQS